MGYAIASIVAAVIVFIVGAMIINAPAFIVAPISVLLFGYGCYEILYGRKDDEAKQKAIEDEKKRKEDSRQAEIQRVKEETRILAENQNRKLAEAAKAEQQRIQRESEEQRRKDLQAQENRFRVWTEQREKQHRDDINRLMESVSRASDDRINQISGQIAQLAEKYNNASVISDLSAQEIEAEVKKREQQIRSESQDILNKALAEAEQKHASQLSEVQSEIESKYCGLLAEKEKKYSHDLNLQQKELDNVRREMAREKAQVVDRLNAEHKQALQKVKMEFETDQTKAIDSMKAQLDKAHRENARLQDENNNLITDHNRIVAIAEEANNRANQAENDRQTAIEKIKIAVAEKDKAEACRAELQNVVSYQNNQLQDVKKEKEQLEEANKRLQNELDARLEEMKKCGKSEQYQDKEIYDLLMRLMGKVQYRMDIICPWASHGVVNDRFMKKLAKMANRNVELYICYGYSEWDKRTPETERCLNKMVALYKEKGKADKIHIRFRKTHEKIIMCDDDLYFTTSCNMLSNPVANGIREGGTLFHDEKSVRYKRKMDFNFSGIVFFSDIGKSKK